MSTIEINLAFGSTITSGKAIFKIPCLKPKPPLAPEYNCLLKFRKVVAVKMMFECNLI